jgi:hypothetical protein
MPSGIDAFLNKASKSQFSKGNEFTFTLLESTFSHVRLQHVAKSPVILKIFDPSGTYTTQTFDSIESIEFELFKIESRVLLRVDEPPRSLRRLLNDMGIVVGFGFSAEPLIFNNLAQLEILRGADSIKLIGFKGIGSDAAAQIVARVEVACKNGVDPAKLPLLESLDYKVDHTTYDVKYKFLSGQITFTSTGILRISGALEPYLLGCVEEHLLTVKA